MIFTKSILVMVDPLVLSEVLFDCSKLICPFACHAIEMILFVKIYWNQKVHGKTIFVMVLSLISVSLKGTGESRWLT